MRLYAISQRSIAFILLVGVLLQSCTNLQIGSWPEEKIDDAHKPTSLHQPITHGLQSKPPDSSLRRGEPYPYYFNTSPTSHLFK